MPLLHVQQGGANIRSLRSHGVARRRRQHRCRPNNIGQLHGSPPGYAPAALARRRHGAVFMLKGFTSHVCMCMAHDAPRFGGSPTSSYKACMYGDTPFYTRGIHTSMMSWLRAYFFKKDTCGVAMQSYI